MARLVLRVSREVLELLLVHQRPHWLAQESELLAGADLLLDLDRRQGQLLRLLRVNSLVVQARLVAELLLDLVDVVLEPGEGVRRLLALGERRQVVHLLLDVCLLYTSPSPRDLSTSRMPSSA